MFCPKKKKARQNIREGSPGPECCQCEKYLERGGGWACMGSEPSYYFQGTVLVRAFSSKKPPLLPSNVAAKTIPEIHHGTTAAYITFRGSPRECWSSQTQFFCVRLRLGISENCWVWQLLSNLASQAEIVLLFFSQKKERLHMLTAILSFSVVSQCTSERDPIARNASETARKSAPNTPTQLRARKKSSKYPTFLKNEIRSTIDFNHYILHSNPINSCICNRNELSKIQRGIITCDCRLV